MKYVDALRKLNNGEKLSESELRTLDEAFSRMDATVRQSKFHMVENNPHNIVTSSTSTLPTSHNLIKNYPTNENEVFYGFGLPEWWEQTDGSLTEEDASTDGLSSYPNDYVFKFVTSAVDGECYQTFAPADEDLLEASSTTVSTGVWVYTASAGTLTLALRDSTTGNIGTDSTTTTSSWVYLEILNKTIGANTLEWSLSHSANAATFYFGNPVLNTGEVVAPFAPRGHKFYYKNTQVVAGVDPGGTGTWHTVTCSALPTNAVRAHIGVMLRNSTSTGDAFYIKPEFDGTTGVNSQTEIIRIHQTGVYHHAQLDVPLNDSKQFFYYSQAGSGDTELLYITVRHAYVWE